MTGVDAFDAPADGAFDLDADGAAILEQDAWGEPIGTNAEVRARVDAIR